MPTFKPKSNKKIKYNKKASVTLDTKHKEFLNEFVKYDVDVIPELKLERQEIKEKIINEIDTISLEQRLNLEDKINEITEKIKEIKNRKKNYFLDNSKYIFEYFENKKNISTGTTAQINTNKTNLVNSFFKIKNEDNINDLELIENNNIVKNKNIIKYNQ
jgi:hypothetical protein